MIAEDIAPRTDRWLFKPMLVSSAVVMLLTILCQLPGSVSFVLIPLSLLSYAVASIVVAGIAIYFFIKSSPRIACSVLFLALLPVLLWRTIDRAAEYVHLGLTAAFRIGQLGTSNSNTGDFAVYDWSVGLAGANTFLIHDVSDEIALPLAQHTHSAAAENGFGEECAGRVRRLTTHYYVCTI